MALTRRPKPGYAGKQKPPYGDFLDWLDRQFTAAFGTAYSSLAEIVAAIETRIDDLEAASVAARTETIRGRLSIASATTPLYFFPGGKQDNDTHSTTIEDHQAIWGRAGTLTNFRLRVLTSSGDADTATFSININGSDSALSISGVAGTDTSTIYLDTSNVTVAATDLVVITRANGSGTGSWQDVVWSVDFIGDL